MSNSLSLKCFQLRKSCLVCGDRASGFNYNGLCCDSCKIFFLRNARKQNLECPNSGTCMIDAFTRKYCAKCRLQKCLLNGMRLKSTEKQMNNSKSNDSRCIRDVLEYLDKTNFMLENPVNHILSQFPYITNAPARVRRKYASDLFSPERELISNIQNMLKSAFVDEKSLQITDPVTNIIDSLNMCVSYVRPTIRFAKSIPAFKQLTEADQILIMKPFFHELLTCWFVYLFDPVKREIPVIRNEYGSQVTFISYDLASQYHSQQDLVEKGLKFHLDLNAEFEDDFTIRDLLITALLFQPRESISNQEFVRYQHSLYCFALKRYLEHKYKNIQQANRKYSFLMKLSREFENQREDARTMISSVIDSSQISQVLVELFNLDELKN